VGAAGKIVVRPGGKRGVLSGGKAALFDGAGECPECCAYCAMCAVNPPPSSIVATFADIAACGGCFGLLGVSPSIFYAYKWAGTPLDVNGAKTLTRIVYDGSCQYKCDLGTPGATLDRWTGSTAQEALDRCNEGDTGTPYYRECPVIWVSWQLEWVATGPSVKIYIDPTPVNQTLVAFENVPSETSPYDCTATYNETNDIPEADCDNLAAYGVSHYGGTVAIVPS